MIGIATYDPRMFMLHGRLAAAPGRRDERWPILAEGEHDEPMPGCRGPDLVAVDATDADGVGVTEVWESEEAHRGSLQLERVREQIARAAPLLDPTGFRRQQLDARGGIPGSDQGRPAGGQTVRPPRTRRVRTMPKTTKKRRATGASGLWPPGYRRSRRGARRRGSTSAADRSARIRLRAVRCRRS